jgi:hypothetical protein
MCFGGGSSSGPSTTPIPTQKAADPTAGTQAIANEPPKVAAPVSNDTVDTNTTDTKKDRGVSSLRIKRGRGKASTGSGDTGLNIPT